MTTKHIQMSGILASSIPASFKHRSIDLSIRGADRTNRDVRPSDGLVFANPYSYEVDQLDDFDSILVRACRALGQRPNALIELDNLLRDPRLPALISSKIFPRDMAPVDTSIPVVIFDEFRNGIRNAVEKVGGKLSDLEGFTDFILFLYGRLAVDAGFVLPARRSAAIRFRDNLIPTFEEIKAGGLATLLERVAAGFKGKIVQFKGSRIPPKMLFQTIQESLSDVSTSLMQLRYQWESIDVLAAVSIGKLINEFDMDPAKAGFMRHPEVDQFLNNFTLITATLDYYKRNPGAYETAIPAQATAEAYGRSFQGLVQAITTSEMFRRTPIVEWTSKSNITRLFTPSRLAVAVMIEPAFRTVSKLQVSYIANTNFKQGVVLTPMIEMERNLQGFAAAAASAAETSVVDLHNVVVDVMFEDGDMLLNDAGSTIALNANIEPGIVPGFNYEPDVLYRNCDESYIAHIAAAKASYLGLTYREGEFILTYFYAPTTPDLHFLMTPLETGVAATEDPALLVFLSGSLETPVSRASDKWETGSQILDEHARSSVISSYEGDLKLFPDLANSLDHKLQLTYTPNKALKQHLGSSSLTATMSIYSLFGGPNYEDADIVQAHLNPVLHLEMTTLLIMMASLYESAETARGRQAVIAGSTKLIRDLMNTREFEIVFRGVLAKLAMQLKTPAARMLFQRSANNQYDMIPLKVTILLKMLLRTRLINVETEMSLAKSKLFTSEELSAALAASLN